MINASPHTRYMSKRVPDDMKTVVYNDKVPNDRPVEDNSCERENGEAGGDADVGSNAKAAASSFSELGRARTLRTGFQKKLVPPGAPHWQVVAGLEGGKKPSPCVKFFFDLKDEAQAEEYNVEPCKHANCPMQVYIVSLFWSTQSHPPPSRTFFPIVPIQHISDAYLVPRISDT